MKNLKKILLMAITISASGICFAQESDVFSALGGAKRIVHDNRPVYPVTYVTQRNKGQAPIPTVTIDPDSASPYKLAAYDYAPNQPVKFNINGKIALFNRETIYIHKPKMHHQVKRQKIALQVLVFLGYEK